MYSSIKIKLNHKIPTKYPAIITFAYVNKKDTRFSKEFIEITVSVQYAGPKHLLRALKNKEEGISGGISTTYLVFVRYHLSETLSFHTYICFVLSSYIPLFFIISKKKIMFYTTFIIDATFWCSGPVDSYATCRGFGPRSDLIFVWSTDFELFRVWMFVQE